jgi:indole-3-glycerol phosphate synthase/phosphoribosylanthranilate isomerase/anthranilate synthase/indole-3-glycerol phosphate synthase/phosphoribosylanthranilate isomerase
MSSTFLDRIVAATRQRVAGQKVRLPLEHLEPLIAQAPAVRAFAQALRPDTLGSAKLIGEVKRASPSRGLLVDTFDPVDQALAYEAGGAAAISILTEPDFFLGSLDYLAAVRAVVGIPVLCKDFILDPYQVYEARAKGADAILLICGLLDEPELATLYQLAKQLGMDALIETHNATELTDALRLQAPVIGINSRDLKTFAVDTGLLRRHGHLVPGSSLLVAESSIGDRLQAAQARSFGADAILVGEALMRAADPVDMARQLSTAPGGAAAYLFDRSRRPFVKLCGLTRPEHGSLAARIGADALGLILAPSRRRISPDQAQDIIQSAGETLAVGVFVNESPETIAAISARIGLGAIQLSGDEPADYCQEVAALTGLPVIKALRPTLEATPESLDAYALSGAALLLDTPSTDGSYGGTGLTGDWSQRREIGERWPIIISGGLTPENVAAALTSVEPAGVDVSSGIETNGTKDAAKMKAFVDAARRAPRSSDSAVPALNTPLI